MMMANVIIIIVMIESQSMIGNLVSDLHKILYDNIYQ